MNAEQGAETVEVVVNALDKFQATASYDVRGLPRARVCACVHMHPNPVCCAPARVTAPAPTESGAVDQGDDGQEVWAVLARGHGGGVRF